MVAIEPTTLVGQILDGRYRVDAHVGEGGMGAVYRAEHLAMAQPVAIKVLLTETASDPSMVKRFVQEARSCFRIDHPNCVRVTDFGAAADGSLYFAMEYLDGRTMGIDIHVDGPMSSPRVRHVAAQVADALHHAHGLGIIHRDLKPGNIMLLQRGGDPDFVKVFDFGLGKLVDQGARLTGLTMSPLTQAGIVFGTPEYMSPEQAKGQPLDVASDVYTLGVCCYEMLTGQLPFIGKTFTETLSKHVTEVPVRPSIGFPHLQIDSGLEELVMRCLAKDSKLRPSTTELAAALRNSQQVTTTASSTIASSETMMVSEESMATLASPRLEPEGAGAPAKSSSARSLWPWLAAMGLLAMVTIGSFILSGNSATPKTGAKGSAASETCDASAPPAFDADPLLADATPVYAFDATIAPAHTPKPTDTRHTKKSPDLHLAAAEQAHRAGNVLKQLAEATASLRKNPKNRRASYLAGDALKKSGDKVAACTYFRRAGKRHARTAGCSN